jgi:uncharacterized membrane protein
MTAERIVRSFTVGAATGLRTMTGPASAFAVRKNGNWNWPVLVGALGEYIVDLLPSTPSRTRPFGLAARAAAAAFTAGALAELDEERWLCAAFGVAGAMGSAFAGRAYRTEAARRNVPDVIAALLEDGVAIALARAAIPRR